MILRILIFITLVYFIYRILNKLLSPFNRHQSQSPGKGAGTSQPKDIPPPYDPNAVEDIDYKEVKKKRDGGRT